MNNPKFQSKQLNRISNALTRSSIQLGLTHELLVELKDILEEEYELTLSDKTVGEVAQFLVNYSSVLEIIERSGDD